MNEYVEVFERIERNLTQLLSVKDKPDLVEWLGTSLLDYVKESKNLEQVKSNRKERFLQESEARKLS